MSELDNSKESIFKKNKKNRKESDAISHQSYQGSNTFYKYSNYHKEADDKSEDVSKANERADKERVLSKKRSWTRPKRCGKTRKMRRRRFWNWD